MDTRRSAVFESWFNDRSAAATVTRSAEEQLAVDVATRTLALYHYDSCIYCARVRSAIARLSLTLELRDIVREPRHRQALVAGGGRATVPCLRIADGADVRWMYESNEIIAYLSARFAPRQSP
jgi:glutaredoxin